MSKPTVHDSAQLEPHWSDDDWGVEISLDDEEIVDQDEGPGILAKFKAVLSRLFGTNGNNEITVVESKSIEAPPKLVCIEEPAIYECQPSVIPSYENDYVTVDLFAVDSEMPKNERRKKKRSHRRKCLSSKQHGIRAQLKGQYLICETFEFKNLFLNFLKNGSTLAFLDHDTKNINK